MPRGGRATHKGINAQGWAAMSLFLQFIDDPTFHSIELEKPMLQDFVLQFNDGKKIVCESKSYKVTPAKIKEILDMQIRGKQLDPEDELLIICQSLDDKIRDLVLHYKYFGFIYQDKLTKQGFTKKQLALFPQVRFWKVTTENNRESTKLLLSRILGLWVPDDRLDEILDSVVVERIYFGSERGDSVLKRQFLDLMAKKRSQIQQDSGYYSARENKEKQLREILDAMDDPRSRLWANNQLSALTISPNILYFLEKLKSRRNLKLIDWNHVWEATTYGFLAFDTFEIFLHNIEDKDNIDYLINALPRFIHRIFHFQPSNYAVIDVVKICMAIMEKAPQLSTCIFDIILQLFEEPAALNLYRETQKDTFGDKVSDLLKTLYTKTTDRVLREKIIKYIYGACDLISDEGEFALRTPDSIFAVVRAYILEDVPKRFPELTQVLISQFLQQYNRFAGWELAGFGVATAGGKHSFHDRHFVDKVLRPALKHYYTANPGEAWTFIMKQCISQRNSEVSKLRPDFLNRAAIDVLLERLAQPIYRKEALKILSQFIRMKQGIPAKVDPLFQAVRDSNLPPNDKWALVEISLRRYENQPINPFVEEIARDLAGKGNNEASRVVAAWVKESDAHVRRIPFSFGPNENIRTLLANPETFSSGVETLKGFLESDVFKTQLDPFHANKIVESVHFVLRKNLDLGLEILNGILSSKRPTPNEQMVVCSSLAAIKEEETHLLTSVHQNFLMPLLDELGNIQKIESRFSSKYARQELVRFAETFAKSGNFGKALRLINLFVEDSDPSLTNSPDDPEGKFNYHQRIANGEIVDQISTVRGWCCWALQKFVTREGQDYLKDVVGLVGRLTRDSNYYVRVQACVPLIELVKYRHTILPGTGNRFIDAQVANVIENIALTMLRDAENQKLRAVMIWLARVFGFMRTSPQEVAIEILEIFKKMNDPEIFREIGPLYIFYAEFRNDALKKASIKEHEELFEEILADLLRSASDEIRAYFAWHFRNLVSEVAEAEADVEGVTPEKAVQIAAKYMRILTYKYEHLTFEHIYGFIKEWIKQDFGISFELWKKCIIREKEFFRKNIDKLKPEEVYWWPFHWNGDILLEIARQRGDNEFLKWLLELSDFPEGVRIMGDLESVLRYLKLLPKGERQVEEAFEKLLKRDSRAFDAKQEWSSAVSEPNLAAVCPAGATKSKPAIRVHNPGSVGGPKGNFLHFELFNDGTADANHLNVSADGFDPSCFQDFQGDLRAAGPPLKIEVRYDRQVVRSEPLPSPRIRIRYRDPQNQRYICEVDLIQQQRADGFYNLGINPASAKTREVPDE